MNDQESNLTRSRHRYPRQRHKKPINCQCLTSFIRLLGGILVFQDSPLLKIF